MYFFYPCVLAWDYTLVFSPIIVQYNEHRDIIRTKQTNDINNLDESLPLEGE
jgi:hypothetical protein